MVAMRMTTIEDGRPAAWAVVPTDDKGSSFTVFPWASRQEGTFRIGAPFINKMEAWIKTNFPSAKFGVVQIESQPPITRPAG